MPNEDTFEQEISTEELGKSADQIKQELAAGVEHHHQSERPQTNTVPKQGNQKSGNEDGGTGHSTASSPESEVETKETGAEGGSSESSSQPSTDDELDRYFTTIEDETEDSEESSGEETPASGINEEEHYRALSEKIGFEVHSDEDVADVIRQLEGRDPLGGVSPLLKQAIEFEQKGGDVRQYFQVLGQDAGTLSNKEALRQVYFNKNSKLAQADRELANSKFEREYAEKYGIIHQELDDTDFDSTSEYNEWLSKKQLAQKELEWEGKESRESLEAQRNEALKSAPSQAQITEQELSEITNKYQKEAKAYVDHFEAIQIPVDAEGKTFYNLGLNEQTRPVFESWAKNPQEFLEYIGFSSDQRNVDSEKLLTHMALAAVFSGEGEYAAGAQMAKHLTERINKGTIERRLENPNQDRPPASATQGGNDVQEAIAALREDVMRRRR